MQEGNQWKGKQKSGEIGPSNGERKQEEQTGGPSEGGKQGGSTRQAVKQPEPGKQGEHLMNAESFRCGDRGHMAQECRRPKKCIRCGLFGHISDHCRTKLLCDYIAPFCAAQVEGHCFFYIPDCPSESTIK